MGRQIRWLTAALGAALLAALVAVVIGAVNAPPPPEPTPLVTLSPEEERLHAEQQAKDDKIMELIGKRGDLWWQIHGDPTVTPDLVTTDPEEIARIEAEIAKIDDELAALGAKSSTP